MHFIQLPMGLFLQFAPNFLTRWFVFLPLYVYLLGAQEGSKYSCFDDFFSASKSYERQVGLPELNLSLSSAFVVVFVKMSCTIRNPIYATLC